MPRSEETPTTFEPAGRRSRMDPWEIVVRQELLKARRRWSQRFLVESEVERVVPGVGDAQPTELPRDPA